MGTDTDDPPPLALAGQDRRSPYLQAGRAAVLGMLGAIDGERLEIRQPVEACGRNNRSIGEEDIERSLEIPEDPASIIGQLDLHLALAAQPVFAGDGLRIDKPQAPVIVGGRQVAAGADPDIAASLPHEAPHPLAPLLADRPGDSAAAAAGKDRHVKLRQDA